MEREESPTGTFTLEELVNLALGTPEIGAVNFNILQRFLLSLLHELNLKDVKAAVSSEHLSIPVPPATSIESDIGFSARKSGSLENLDKKVSKLENQISALNALPSNSDLLGKTKSTHGVSDIWQHMQLQKTVQNNEDGLTRALSLIDDILKEMQKLRDEQERMNQDLQGLKEKLEQTGNMDEFESRLKGLENYSEMLKKLEENLEDVTKRLAEYPDPSEFENFITWPVLQEALSQHMQKMEEIQQAKERVESETEDVADAADAAEEMLSVPVSVKPSPTSSRLSSAKERFPEATEMLERIGALNDKHVVLEGKVDVIEETLPTKADKSDLEGLRGAGDIPEDLLEQLNCLKEAITALQNDRDQMGELLKLQQDSIDSILSFRGSFAGSDEDSSGYESGNPSQKDLRKLDLACQRLGQKLNAHVKLLNDTDSGLKFKIDDLKRAIDGINRHVANVDDRLKEQSDMNRNLYLTLTQLEQNNAADSVGSGGGRLRSIDNAAKSSLSLLRKQESDAIAGIQTTLLNLQAELEKLSRLVDSALEEHKEKQKHIDTLYDYAEKLSDTKADKENVRMEIDVKADKKSVETKVNRTDFDSATSEIMKNLDDLLEKILGQESNWEKELKKLSADVDGKLDRLELENLKQHLENRMKAMKKLMEKYQQPQEMYEGDDAAGFRKQLLHNYHCISCDRPVELTATGPMPSIPANAGLPTTKSVRPYTSFELDQIRQQARGVMQIGRNSTNFRAALEEREMARLRKLDELAFKTHYLHGDPQYAPKMDTEEVDYVTPSGRSCGGGYTLTYPHRRYTRLTHLSELWQDEDTIVDNAKQEVELQGHDGHIYKGRLPVLQLHQHMSGKSPTAPPDSGYDTTYGNKINMPNRPRSARSVGRPFSAGRRTPASMERPRTAGRVPSHVTVGTQDVQKSAESLTAQTVLTVTTD